MAFRSLDPYGGGSLLSSWTFKDANGVLTEFSQDGLDFWDTADLTIIDAPVAWANEMPPLGYNMAHLGADAKSDVGMLLLGNINASFICRIFIASDTGGGSQWANVAFGDHAVANNVEIYFESNNGVNNIIVYLDKTAHSFTIGSTTTGWHTVGISKTDASGGDIVSCYLDGVFKGSIDTSSNPISFNDFQPITLDLNPYTAVTDIAYLNITLTEAQHLQWHEDTFHTTPPHRGLDPFNDGSLIDSFSFDGLLRNDQDTKSLTDLGYTYETLGGDFFDQNGRVLGVITEQPIGILNPLSASSTYSMSFAFGMPSFSCHIRFELGDLGVQISTSDGYCYITVDRWCTGAMQNAHSDNTTFSYVQDSTLSFTITYDGTNTKIYYNTELQATFNEEFIGGFTNFSVWYDDARIDELLFFNRALLEDEALLVNNAWFPLPLPYPSARGLDPFGDGSMISSFTCSYDYQDDQRNNTLLNQSLWEFAVVPYADVGLKTIFQDLTSYNFDILNIPIIDDTEWSFAYTYNATDEFGANFVAFDMGDYRLVVYDDRIYFNNVDNFQVTISEIHLADITIVVTKSALGVTKLYFNDVLQFETSSGGASTIVGKQLNVLVDPQYGGSGLTTNINEILFFNRELTEGEALQVLGRFPPETRVYPDSALINLKALYSTDGFKATTIPLTLLPSEPTVFTETRVLAESLLLEVTILGGALIIVENSPILYFTAPTTFTTTKNALLAHYTFIVFGREIETRYDNNGLNPFSSGGVIEETAPPELGIYALNCIATASTANNVGVTGDHRLQVYWLQYHDPSGGYQFFNVPLPDGNSLYIRLGSTPSFFDSITYTLHNFSESRSGWLQMRLDFDSAGSIRLYIEGDLKATNAYYQPTQGNCSIDRSIVTNIMYFDRLLDAFEEDAVFTNFDKGGYVPDNYALVKPSSLLLSLYVLLQHTSYAVNESQLLNVNSINLTANISTMPFVSGYLKSISIVMLEPLIITNVVSTLDLKLVVNTPTFVGDVNVFGVTVSVSSILLKVEPQFPNYIGYVETGGGVAPDPYPNNIAFAQTATLRIVPYYLAHDNDAYVQASSPLLRLTPFENRLWVKVYPESLRIPININSNIAQPKGDRRVVQIGSVVFDKGLYWSANSEILDYIATTATVVDGNTIYSVTPLKKYTKSYTISTKSDMIVSEETLIELKNVIDDSIQKVIFNDGSFEYIKFNLLNKTLLVRATHDGSIRYYIEIGVLL